MGERIEHFLDSAAKPSLLGSGMNLRVFWNSVPRNEDEASADDKNWAASEPDPDAP